MKKLKLETKIELEPTTVVRGYHVDIIDITIQVHHGAWMCGYKGGRKEVHSIPGDKGLWLSTAGLWSFVHYGLIWEDGLLQTQGAEKTQGTQTGFLGACERVSSSPCEHQHQFLHHENL